MIACDYEKDVAMALDIMVIAGAAILLSLFFDFTNGFHDASSVVATVIACGAMDPKRALALAGFFTILGALLGGSAVVYTIEELVFIEPGRQLVTILVAATSLYAVAAVKLLGRINQLKRT